MISIVLPLYNEEENLKPLLKKILNVLENNNISGEIICVNDGSTDNTATEIFEIANKFDAIKYVEHQKNRGLPDALKTGLKSASGDAIITMDGDNTHDPTSILDMLQGIEDGNSIIIGSRYVKGGKQLNVPIHRKILSKGINVIASKISGIPVEDVTSGYRCYKTESIQKALNLLDEKFIESKGFEVSVEILLKTYFYGDVSRISEVPIILDYGKKKGTSKMVLVPTIISYITLLKKIRKWKRMKI